MRYVKVTRNAQVTIPADIRREFNIREGDYVVFEVVDGNIILKPLKRRSRLTMRAGFRLSVEEMERTVGEFMDEATR